MSTQASASKAPEAAPQLYFHLLWDHELDYLSGILDAILRRRDEVLAHWHQLYVLHFGDTRSLSEPEFISIFSTDLAATIGDLRAKDVDKFIRDVRQVGETLAARRVPFPEVVVSMHLFEESAATAFPSFPPAMPKAYLAFDKLSHCRMIVLADAYFRSTSAMANARIRDLEQEAAQLPLASRSRFHGLVGGAPAMHQLYGRIDALSRTRDAIVIVGERGTGKELTARAIHEAGADPQAPFVCLDCAALPVGLIESELFGYRSHPASGANGTGAEYLGLLRSAEGGTLLLGEITRMSLETQRKLLQVLPEPTGRSVRPATFDVRLIATTSHEPAQALRDKTLLPDLYERLQDHVLRVPPLRERREDIAPLSEHFITLSNERLNRRTPVAGLAQEALDAMGRYPWPGNVGELAGVVERAFTRARGSMITPADLPDEIAAQVPKAAPGPADELDELSEPTPLPTFAEVERNLIKRALAATDGNKVQAARLLRISRKKLYAKIEKYGL